MPRPRTPTALKVLTGNPGKRPLPKGEPKPRPLMPAKPDWLGEDASAEWDRYARMLFNSGVLTEVDGTAFAGYCEAFGAWRIAARDQAEDPSDWRKLVAVREAFKLLRAAGSDFGLNPVSRSKIDIGKRGDADDDLLD